MFIYSSVYGIYNLSGTNLNYKSPIAWVAFHLTVFFIETNLQIVIFTNPILLENSETYPNQFYTLKIILAALKVEPKIHGCIFLMTPSCTLFIRQVYILILPNSKAITNILNWCIFP